MSVFTSLLQRLAAATPRERAGLALVAALAACAGAAVSFDWAMRAQAAALETGARLAEAQGHYERDGAAAFQESLALEANKVWRWSIVQSSEGVARAQAVAAVEALALQAGMNNVRVELSERAPEEDDAALISPIELALSADFDWVSFGALLDAMRASDLSFTIDAVAVDGGGGEQAPALSLTLTAPFLHETEPP